MRDEFCSKEERRELFVVLTNTDIMFTTLGPGTDVCGSRKKLVPPGFEIYNVVNFSFELFER